MMAATNQAQKTGHVIKHQPYNASMKIYRYTRPNLIYGYICRRKFMFGKIEADSPKIDFEF